MDLSRQISTALDDLSSSRSSFSRRQRALDQLERVVAETCAAANGDPTRFGQFLELQDGFECNIASRLLTFITCSLPTLKACKLEEEEDATEEERALFSCVAQAMSLLQGVALLHAGSKAFLARKWVMELFLSLLICRQPTTPEHSLPASPTKSPRKISSIPNSAPNLAIAIIDTLLCVLVDAPLAIRAFEEVNGLEIIVKSLKRVGIPRDIRMKCLEFLYWYLLPEDTPPSRNSSAPTPSLPGSPTKRSTVVPLQPTSSWPSSAPMPPPPIPSTPPRSPTKPTRSGLLRRELDFVPTTPKKVQVSKLGVGTPRASRVTASPSGSPVKRRVAPSVERSSRMLSRDSSMASSENVFIQVPSRSATSAKPAGQRIKSTEEKKALLGTLLGNVDVLVEGVCKAGIWGLG